MPARPLRNRIDVEAISVAKNKFWRGQNYTFRVISPQILINDLCEDRCFDAILLEKTQKLDTFTGTGIKIWGGYDPFAFTSNLRLWWRMQIPSVTFNKCAFVKNQQFEELINSIFNFFHPF